MAKFVVGEKFVKPAPRSPELVKALQTVVKIPPQCTTHLRIRTTK